MFLLSVSVSVFLFLCCSPVVFILSEKVGCCLLKVVVRLVRWCCAVRVVVVLFVICLDRCLSDFGLSFENAVASCLGGACFFAS